MHTAFREAAATFAAFPLWGKILLLCFLLAGIIMAPLFGYRARHAKAEQRLDRTYCRLTNRASLNPYLWLLAVVFLPVFGTVLFAVCSIVMPAVKRKLRGLRSSIPCAETEFPVNGYAFSGILLTSLIASAFDEAKTGPVLAFALWMISSAVLLVQTVRKPYYVRLSGAGIPNTARHAAREEITEGIQNPRIMPEYAKLPDRQALKQARLILSGFAALNAKNVRHDNPDGTAEITGQFQDESYEILPCKKAFLEHHTAAENGICTVSEPLCAKYLGTGVTAVNVLNWQMLSLPDGRLSMTELSPKTGIVYLVRRPLRYALAASLTLALLLTAFCTPAGGHCLNAVLKLFLAMMP